MAPKAKPKFGCKHRYDKTNYCTFCFNPVKGKISRHLLCGKHSDKLRVLEIKMLPKKSKERVIKLEILANEGNFKHNIEVMKKGTGNLVVARRVSMRDDIEEGHQTYLPCEYCLKFVVSRHLGSHVHMCAVRKYLCLPDPTRRRQRYPENDESGDEEEDVLASEDHDTNFARRGRSLLRSALLDAGSEQHAAVLIDRLTEGHIKEIVKNDILIKRFLELRGESLGHVADQKRKDVYKVNNGARSLGRLLVEARKVEPLITLTELITPKYFDLVVNSTKNLCELDAGTNLNFGSKIGNLLGHLVMMKSGNAIRNNNDSCMSDATKFEILLKSEWNNRVNAILTKRKNNLSLAKRNEIPLTHDLVKFKDYLCQKMDSLTASLPTLAPGPSKAKQYLALSKVTLCRLILFNKRRVSELSEMKIESYMNRPSWTQDCEEIKNGLSDIEKEMAKR